MASPAAKKKIEAAEGKAKSANKRARSALQKAEEARQFAADIIGAEKARMVETPLWTAAGGGMVGVVEGAGMAMEIPVLGFEVSAGALPALASVVAGITMENRALVEFGSGGLAGVAASIGRQIAEDVLG